jgi:hypothetical protein
MNDEQTRDITAIGARLADQAHAVWLAAAADATQAYHAWGDAVHQDRGLRYAAYSAALDREESAARDLERVWELARPCREGSAVAGVAEPRVLEPAVGVPSPQSAPRGTYHA